MVLNGRELAPLVSFWEFEKMITNIIGRPKGNTWRTLNLPILPTLLHSATI